MKVKFFRMGYVGPVASIEWTGKRFIMRGDIKLLEEEVNNPLPDLISPHIEGPRKFVQARATPELWLRNLPLNYRGAYFFAELVDHQPNLPGL